MQIDSGDDDDVEIVVLPHGQEVPADAPEVDESKLTIDKSEWERMKQQNDLLAAQRETLNGVQSIVQSQQRQYANQALPPNYKTDAEFDQEIENEIVAAGGTRKAISKVLAREMAPIVQHYEQQLADLRKEQVSSDPALGGVMKKYGKEVDEILAHLPPAQRASKQAYEFAVAQVQAKHLDEIVEERIAARLAEKEKEKPSDEGSQRVATKRPQMEAGRMSQGAGTKKTVYITDQLRREAARNHMSVEEYARLKARSGR
jgi:hypothetical protein